jgi:uncharacterized protein YecA (UPF0149 family)
MIMDAIAPPKHNPDAKTQAAIREVLNLLPADVVQELNSGRIDVHDPAFLEGLADHVSRLAIASPTKGQQARGKFMKLKKMISRSLRESDPEAVVSSTLRGAGRVGRNAACPCGSGRKFKQCCWRKENG